MYAALATKPWIKVYAEQVNSPCSKYRREDNETPSLSDPSRRKKISSEFWQSLWERKRHNKHDKLDRNESRNKDACTKFRSEINRKRKKETKEKKKKTRAQRETRSLHGNASFIRLYEVFIKRKSIIQPGFIACHSRWNAIIRKINLTPTRTHNDKRWKPSGLPMNIW